MEKFTTVGLDLAKPVFQVHAIDATDVPIVQSVFTYNGTIGVPIQSGQLRD